MRKCIKISCQKGIWDCGTLSSLVAEKGFPCITFGVHSLDSASMVHLCHSGTLKDLALQCASHVWLLLGFTVSRRSLRGPWWKQPEVPGRFVRKSKNVSIGRPEAVSQTEFNYFSRWGRLDAWMHECMDGARAGLSLSPSLSLCVDFSIELYNMYEAQWIPVATQTA